MNILTYIITTTRLIPYIKMSYGEPDDIFDNMLEYIDDLSGNIFDSGSALDLSKSGRSVSYQRVFNNTQWYSICGFDNCR